MKKLLIYLSIIGLFLTSCQRDETKGLAIGYASDDFKLTSPLSLSTSPINFQEEDSVSIKASFNENVAYTLTITGAQSGAVRTITGTGTSIDAIWKGDASLIFFREEPIQLSLTVLGKNEVLSDLSSEITATANFDGIIIGDFEQTTANCWFPDNNAIACNTTFQAPIALEGSFAHQVIGKSTQTPLDNFVGLADISPRRGVNRNGLYFTVPTLDPDQLYFNIYLYGTGDQNVAMFIKFMQDDNGNGSHEADKENGFEMQLTDLSHTGWKKFSFKYADVPLGGNTGFGGNGDGVYRPDKIRKIELGLWALKDPTRQVEFIYDFASFTANNPIGE